MSEKATHKAGEDVPAADLCSAVGSTQLLPVIDVLEDVFEAAIVSLQNGVLGAHVERPAFRQRHLEGTVGKILNRLVKIVHSHGHTTTAC